MFQTIIIPMTLGFAVFMSGMKLMEVALHQLAGPHLAKALQSSTSTPVHGLVTGTAASAFLQSSTAVTVITIGLVNARLLTFPRTLGIILGTNIGTCLTTELIGLQLNRFAGPLMIASLGLWAVTALAGEMNVWPGLARFFGGRRLAVVRAAAVTSGGFGMLLAGLTFMQSIGPSVEQSGMFDWFLAKASGELIWGLLAGAVLTAAVHSSAAVIGMVMGLAALGSIPPDISTAIVLGSNVGTCVTALLASVGGTKGGKFVALSHLLLNAGGALLFMPFVSELSGAAGQLSSSPSGQIAHVQTLFNVACSLLALPVCYLPALKRLDR
ncbi:Na/Pi cotransporter family protein [Paenibacillus thailandensis]|uniref:Na/Pi cotransporter family protein n=1 Tax=Paenibacillus thailandensis TaxID=393250 RepID=A0ABW5QYP6_9BACL